MWLNYINIESHTFLRAKISQYFDPMVYISANERSQLICKPSQDQKKTGYPNPVKNQGSHNWGDLQLHKEISRNIWIEVQGSRLDQHVVFWFLNAGSRCWVACTKFFGLRQPEWLVQGNCQIVVRRCPGQKRLYMYTNTDYRFKEFFRVFVDISKSRILRFTGPGTQELDAGISSAACPHRPRGKGRATD